MRLHPARTALCMLLGASILSCTDSLTAVSRPRALSSLASETAVPMGHLVISHIYGGGGNNGSTLKNDFVELFNRGTADVTVDGWSVQYASAAGTTWQVTSLKGVIPAGGYYLVQESQGAGGTQALPTPDATGTIAMSANNGKVAIVSSTTALSGGCPGAIQVVSFGTGNCGSPTAGIDASSSVLRRDAGCRDTNNPTSDFIKSNPAVTLPRNSATRPYHVCPPVGPFDHLTITGDSEVAIGATTQLTANPQDANDQAIASIATVWSSNNTAIATVDDKGVVTGVAANANQVTITLSATADDTTITATFKIKVTLPEIKFINVGTSADSIPPGFQAQLFPSALTGRGGNVIQATFAFEALDPQLATIDSKSGLITAVSVLPSGTTSARFKITATPVSGGPSFSFDNARFTIERPSSSPTSIYGTNDEFGDPSVVSTSDPNNFLISRPQYTLSYNTSHGTPNWVSYELDKRQLGNLDRCDCFTVDPLLPADKQILYTDYTNGGFDRGHMARSADRTTANLDNAATFYMTNIVPQQGDLNQGVWAQFENALGDSAKAGRAVYVITGPLYDGSKSLTFLKNEGKIAIPDATWKVALIGPMKGADGPFTHVDLQNWSDLAGYTLLAVNMPNVSGVRNDPWAKYLTTVTALEQATGYDFLSLLNTAFQSALEVHDHAPTAKLAVSGDLREPATLSFDASASTDADIGRTDLGRSESLSYSWSFSDGTTATGPSVTHSFPKYGNYTATITVTDAFGWPTVVQQALKIDDVAPMVALLATATLITGETYSANVTFTDPGIESWTANVAYGDGAMQTMPNVGKSFAISHTYTTSCNCTVSVNVDDGALSGAAKALVTVLTPLEATKDLGHQVQLLAESALLLPQDVQPLLASLDAATRQLLRLNPGAAGNELGAFINKVTAEVLSGRMDSRAAQQLISFAQRIQRAM